MSLSWNNSNVILAPRQSNSSKHLVNAFNDVSLLSGSGLPLYLPTYLLSLQMISKTDTFMSPFINSSVPPTFFFSPSPLTGLKKDSSILNCLKNWQQSHPSSIAKGHKYRGVENPGFVNASSHTRLFKSEVYVGLEVDLQENSLTKLLVPHNNILLYV